MYHGSVEDYIILYYIKRLYYYYLNLYENKYFILLKNMFKENF